MDLIELRRKIRDGSKKFRAALIVILAGILLMAIPAGKEKPEPEKQQPAVQAPRLEEQLAQFLTGLAGAGKVKVLLTEDAGPQNVYVFDEDKNTGSGTLKRTTVVVSDRSRGETGLIRQITAPRYRGAVILCQGADSAGVRLNITEAVASVTGLSTDKITVLKMK